MPDRQRMEACAAVVALGMLTSTPALADGTIYGCANSRGRVRLIMTSPPTCRATETPVSWNQVGPQGPAGPQGPPGPGPTDISARVFNSSNIAIGAAPSVILPFDSERWDTNNIHDETAGDNCSLTPNRCRLIARTPGKYLVFGHVSWEAMAGGYRSLAVRRNGIRIATTRVAGIGGSTQEQSITTHYDLAVGDYLELEVGQDFGAPINLLAGAPDSIDFGMVKVP